MFGSIREFAMLRYYTAEEMAERSANGITAGGSDFPIASCLPAVIPQISML